MGLFTKQFWADPGFLQGCCFSTMPIQSSVRGGGCDRDTRGDSGAACGELGSCQQEAAPGLRPLTEGEGGR